MIKYINKWVVGDKIDNDLLINTATRNTANNGIPYLTLILQDKSSVIEAKKWEINENDLAIAVPGTVVHFIGDVIDYRGSIQLRITSMQSVIQSTVDYTRFCLESPIPTEELERKLKNYIAEIQNEDCKEIIRRVMERHYNDFIIFPAAVKNHHEYASGLLSHTVEMLDLASAIQNIHKEIDRDLLLTGVILHDVGKTIEFNGPIATRYTTEGRLLGHISIMAAEIKEIADQANIHSDIPLYLEHMILSHHGEQEFGSPVCPMTLEAFVLHFVDDFDAKITMINKALQCTKEGEFSQRLIALNNIAFYKMKK